MARHETPKSVKQKKAAPRKRPAKVAALIAPLESIEEHGASIVLDSCPPAEVPEEHLPEIHAALYPPGKPFEEPHAIVIVAAGKKSFWKRWFDFSQGI